MTLGGTPERRNIWAWRLRHPSCWIRVARGSIRSAWLWRRQGRPTDIPIVIKPGRLLAAPDGRGGGIWDFHFDMSRMAQPVHIDELWDRLSAMYPVERVSHLP